jgi:hypothetical protein
MNIVGNTFIATQNIGGHLTIGKAYYIKRKNNWSYELDSDSLNDASVSKSGFFYYFKACPKLSKEFKLL